MSLCKSRRPTLMAVQTNHRDISFTLKAARQWIDRCLVEDGSVFTTSALWTEGLLGKVRVAFVDHPDSGKDDFITKLKGQLKSASPSTQQLTAEMMWALLLFPSNIR